MIKSFKDRRTALIAEGQTPKGVALDIARRAARKLILIKNAERVEDLAIPPGNRLHPLKGDRNGQWSISVNDQWRICFVWKNNDAYDVEFTDYH